MIAELKPYPAYGESGVPWLGDVPAHWHVLPLKRCVRVNSEVLQENTNPDFEFRYIDIGLVGTGHLTGKAQVLRFRAAPSRARRIVHLGDTLVSTVRTYLKAVYYISEPATDLVASTGFAVLTPGPALFPPFLSYVVQSDPFTNRVSADSVGTAYPAIAESRLASLEIVVPPLPEQRAIVRYLDFVDRRIRRYIRAKRKLIKLLEEQKQAIIHQAVTRGLDPNVRLKPSGVEWLGDVPEHWEVKRAKFLLREIDERSATGEEELLSVSHLTGVTPRREKTVTMFKAESYVGHKICRPGDIAVNTMWVWMGALGVSRFGGIVSPSYAVYRLHEVTAFHPTYLDNLLRAKPYVSEYVRQSTGIRASRLRFYPDQFLRLPLVQPPHQEQVEIAARLDDEGRGITEAIAKIESQISILQEYRTRLIADVVTGKLDVREAAARLPEEPEEAEPEDEDEALDEDAGLDEDPEAGDEEE